ncbi:MAG: hypothetical protein ABSB42_06720 [Tepidisphaeraceae bacterium]
MKLYASRPHEVDVRLRRFVAILEGPFLFRLSPKHLVISVGIERRVDVDQVDALFRQLRKLVEVIATVDDPGIDKGGRFCLHVHKHYPIASRKSSSVTEGPLKANRNFACFAAIPQFLVSTPTFSVITQPRSASRNFATFTFSR